MLLIVFSMASKRLLGSTTTETAIWKQKELVYMNLTTNTLMVMKQTLIIYYNLNMQGLYVHV